MNILELPKMSKRYSLPDIAKNHESTNSNNLTNIEEAITLPRGFRSDVSSFSKNLITLRNLLQTLFSNHSEEKFLRRRIEKKVVTRINERKEFLEAKYQTMLKYVKDLCEKISEIQRKRRCRPKRWLNPGPSNFELQMLFLTSQLRKYFSLFFEIKRSFKRFNSFLRRIQIFSTQSYVISKDYSYSLNVLETCTIELQREIKEIEYILSRNHLVEMKKIININNPKKKKECQTQKSQKKKQVNNYVKSQEVSISSMKPIIFKRLNKSNTRKKQDQQKIKRRRSISGYSTRRSIQNAKKKQNASLMKNCRRLSRTSIPRNRTSDVSSIGDISPW